MKISTILEKIDENQLFVPAFQREYVWKRDDAKRLIRLSRNTQPADVDLGDREPALAWFPGYGHVMRAHLGDYEAAEARLKEVVACAVRLGGGRVRRWSENRGRRVVCRLG